MDMSGTGPGYSQTIFITPYMHNLVYHVPVMLQKHESLKMFSGQSTNLFFTLVIHCNSTQDIFMIWHLLDIVRGQSCL